MNNGKDNSDNKIISEIVDKSKSRAEEYLDNPQKAHKLLSEADEKANSKENSRGKLSDIWNYLRAMLRLLRSYINREYIVIPWRAIVLVVIAIIYFVALVDLMPDFIPGIGYIDDAAVIAFVVAQIKLELDKFIKWENEHKNAK